MRPAASKSQALRISSILRTCSGSIPPVTRDRPQNQPRQSSRKLTAISVGALDSAIASTAIAATVDDSAVPPFGLVDLFRAVNDPTRLRILLLLRRFELAIGELAILLNQSQPRVSRHVRLLEEAGLAERRKEGSWVFVRLMRGERIDALFALVDAVAMSSDEGRFIQQDSARLQAVRAEREAAATRYFANHANEWDAIRSLHVAEEEVERAILAIMRNRRVGHLLDVGTGTGRMAGRTQ